MILKGMAFIFTILFILLGILSFIPSLTFHSVLFKLCNVGSLLGLLYSATGLTALSASGSTLYARLFFKFSGMLYAAIAILGFAFNGNLGLVRLTIGYSFFHLGVAIIALYLGFTSKLPRIYAH